MKRGELWTVAGGVYSSKPRPALVIQDEVYESEDSLTVIPLTTTVRDAPLWRVPVVADETTGIRADSQVMINKITTIKRQRLGERLGRITSADLLAVERLLMVFLGLAR